MAAAQVEATTTLEVRPLGKVAAFDGLRAIAVILVLLDHTPLLVDIFHNRVSNVAVINNFFTGGFVGVDLFFVLSGFFITALALNEYARRAAFSLPAFYRRRALRLLPALVAVLVAHAIYTASQGASLAQERTTDLAALFYFANYRMTYAPGSIAPSMGHLWSLSIEEQFYLVWPAMLLVMLSNARLRRWLPTIVITLIVLVTVRRATLYLATRQWTEVVWRTDARADALLIGALAAWVWTRRTRPIPYAAIWGWIALAALVVDIDVSHADGSWPYLGGYTTYALCSVALLFAVLDSSWAMNRLLESRVLGAIGRTSYGIYLWHLPIFYVVAQHGSHWTSLERVVCAYALTAAFTAASYAFIERPALAWKVRLEARRSAAGERAVAERPASLDEHR